ncbi:MAG: LiaF transmembrane domain-containing protein [Flavisolibacter sp.]
MNEQEFKNGIEERWDPHPRSKSGGRVFMGLLLFIIGILLLLRTSNMVWFPGWFFTWPMIFIAIGLFTGLKHGFRGGAWFIFLLVGGLFLLNEIDTTWHMERYVWPIVLIAIGIGFILRPRRHDHWRRWQRYQYRSRWQDREPAVSENVNTGSQDFDRRDFIDITAIFGGTKKNVLSKNFKGGDITSFMGGSEIDLTQSDFSGRVIIDVTNIFGGTKLIVPPSWDVQNDITAIFGGVEDKRQLNGVTLDQNKTLVLDGTCMFGGIEIRSF